MGMTDPIADFLTRLRNANSAYHDEVTLPHSKIKANIAEILKSGTVSLIFPGPTALRYRIEGHGPELRLSRAEHTPCLASRARSKASGCKRGLSPVLW